MDSTHNNKPPQAEKPMNVIIKKILSLVPVWLRTPSGTDITSTTVGAKQAVDVNVVGSTSVVGDATAANQVLQTALLTTIDADTGTIAGGTTSIDGKITACNTGAVTVAASALPVGGATSALQTSSEAILTTIDADTGTIATNTGTIAGKDFSTETTLAALNALVTSGNALLTLIKNTDGIKKITDAVAVTGTFYQATQPVSGTVAVSNDVALETGGNLAAIATDAGQIETLLTGTVSASNSTTTPLAGAATFTGTATECMNYGAIVVSTLSNVVSANPGLFIDFSSDGTNWDYSTQGTYVAAGAAREITIAPIAKYFRVRYINGATIQASFRLQTILLPHAALSTVTTGDTIYGKRGMFAYYQSTGSAAVIPTAGGLGNADSIAPTYSGVLEYGFVNGYDPVLDKWHRVRVTSTSKVLRTAWYPDRPTSDLGAACVNFDHGTVVADYTVDSAAAKTQSASYNLWITDISIFTTTDITGFAQMIPVALTIYDSTDSQNRWLGTLGFPCTSSMSFKTPILIPKGHDYYTKIQLGGSDNLYIYVIINGFEEA